MGTEFSFQSVQQPTIEPTEMKFKLKLCHDSQFQEQTPAYKHLIETLNRLR